MNSTGSALVQDPANGIVSGEWTLISSSLDVNALTSSGYPQTVFSGQVMEQIMPVQALLVTFYLNLLCEAHACFNCFYLSTALGMVDMEVSIQATEATEASLAWEV